ncbi:MAG: hypothetical protein GXO23_03865 [Crenarchaeota archaeon]|nr:hypothetical protein [Thermoproteota archaeon]
MYPSSFSDNIKIWFRVFPGGDFITYDREIPLSQDNISNIFRVLRRSIQTPDSERARRIFVLFDRDLSENLPLETPSLLVMLYKRIVQMSGSGYDSIIISIPANNIENSEKSIINFVETTCSIISNSITSFSEIFSKAVSTERGGEKKTADEIRSIVTAEASPQDFVYLRDRDLLNIFSSKGLSLNVNYLERNVGKKRAVEAVSTLCSTIATMSILIRKTTVIELCLDELCQVTPITETLKGNIINNIRLPIIDIIETFISRSSVDYNQIKSLASECSRTGDFIVCRLFVEKLLENQFNIDDIVGRLRPAIVSAFKRILVLAKEDSRYDRIIYQLRSINPGNIEPICLSLFEALSSLINDIGSKQSSPDNYLIDLTFKLFNICGIDAKYIREISSNEFRDAILYELLIKNASILRENLVDVCSLLPYVKNSYRLVMDILKLSAKDDKKLISMLRDCDMFVDILKNFLNKIDYKLICDNETNILGISNILKELDASKSRAVLLGLVRKVSEYKSGFMQRLFQIFSKDGIEERVTGLYKLFENNNYPELIKRICSERLEVLQKFLEKIQVYERLSERELAAEVLETIREVLKERLREGYSKELDSLLTGFFNSIYHALESSRTVSKGELIRLLELLRRFKKSEGTKT